MVVAWVERLVDELAAWKVVVLADVSDLKQVVQRVATKDCQRVADLVDMSELRQAALWVDY